MRSLLARVTVAVAAIALSAGCTDLGVGQKCVNPLDAGVSGIEIVSPALECSQRMCFLSDSGRNVCTAFCSTDDDCAGATTGSVAGHQCPSSFVCAVATVAGPFCCKKICICKDDLTDNLNRDPSTMQVITPSACTAANSSCTNVGH